MKKIKVQILKDDKVGLKKGEVKILALNLANDLIKSGKAKSLEVINVIAKTEINQLVGDLIKKVGALEKRVAKLEKKQAPSKLTPGEPVLKEKIEDDLTK